MMLDVIVLEVSQKFNNVFFSLLTWQQPQPQICILMSTSLRSTNRESMTKWMEIAGKVSLSFLMLQIGQHRKYSFIIMICSYTAGYSLSTCWHSCIRKQRTTV